MTLDVNGRAAMITSTFTHRTRSLSALAGYGHELTPRVAVAYLIGVAVTDVRRDVHLRRSDNRTGLAVDRRRRCPPSRIDFRP